MRFVWLFLSFVLSALWSYLCLKPPGRATSPMFFEREDLMFHAVAYWFFGFVLFRAAQSLNVPIWRAGAVSFCFGLLIEWLQYLMNLGRNAELLDVFANSFGLGLAYLFFKLL